MATQQERNSVGLRRSRWLVFRSSYPELENATLPSWFEEIPEAFGQFSWTKPYHHYVKFDDVRAEFVFMGLDDPDGPEKLKGMQFTGAWANEVVTIPRSVVNMVMRRIDRYPSKSEGGATRACIIGDTNAPEEGHWYHKLEQQPPEGWEFFSQPPAVKWNGQKWVVNPGAENLQNLSEEYYPGQIDGSTEEEIRVLLANEFGFIVRGMAVFPEYNDQLHTRNYEPEVGIPLAVGCDCTGLSPAMVVAQKMRNGQIRVLSELCTRNVGMVRFSELAMNHLQSMYPGFMYEHMTGDPRGDQRGADMRNNFQIAQAHGFPLRSAHTNDFIVRREAVAKALSTVLPEIGEPQLVFHSRCVVTRKGMSGGYMYRRRQTREESHEDRPAKNQYADPCDSVQYLMLGYGAGRALKRVRQPGSRAMAQTVADNDYDVYALR